MGLFLIAARPQSAMTFFDVDLLHPSEQMEKRKHKLKRLVQSPNSYFMDVKCPGCFSITTVFSNAQTVVLCGNCSTVLCQPTGGKCRLTEVAPSGERSSKRSVVVDEQSSKTAGVNEAGGQAIRWPVTGRSILLPPHLMMRLCMHVQYS